MRNLPSRVRIPLACAFMSAIVVSGQTVAWAVTACQIPNPSTTYCYPLNTHVLSSCSAASQPGDCNFSYVVHRNLFPNGAVTAASGTTTQQSVDCWQKQQCFWNTNLTIPACVAGSDWSPWYPANKTVVGTNQCPTDEG